MIVQVFSIKRNNGSMALAFVVVLLISISFSVCLYLFLGKKTANTKETFNKNFDEEKLKPEEKNKEKLISTIEGHSNDIAKKTTEFSDSEKNESKLKAALKLAQEKAEERKKALKITALETTAIKEFNGEPVIGKKEIEDLIATIDKISEKIKNTKAFDEKALGMEISAILLNDDLKNFLSKKQIEASNNPNFKEQYGLDWVKIINDLKNKGKESVFSGLEIKKASDLPKSPKGMDSLKNLLSDPEEKKLNYYFAFVYFPLHKFEPFINNLKIENVAMPEQDFKKNKLTLEAKQAEFKRYVKKYGDFLEGLKKDPLKTDNK